MRVSVCFWDCSCNWHSICKLFCSFQSYDFLLMLLYILCTVFVCTSKTRARRFLFLFFFFVIRFLFCFCASARFWNAFELKNLFYPFCLSVLILSASNFHFSHSPWRFSHQKNHLLDTLARVYIRCVLCLLACVRVYVLPSNFRIASV